MKSLDYVVHKSIKHQLSALIKLLFNFDKDSFFIQNKYSFLFVVLLLVILLFIVAPIVFGILHLVLVLLFSTLCLSSFASILMGKRELVALL